MAIAVSHPNNSSEHLFENGNALNSQYGIMSGGNGVDPSDAGVGSGSLSKRPGRAQEVASMDRRKSEKVTGLRSRKNSLRRVKDSTDMLRERSNQGQNGRERLPDANSAARGPKGSKFTVSNVGNNGKIYLRSVSFLPLVTNIGCFCEDCVLTLRLGLSRSPIHDEYHKCLLFRLLPLKSLLVVLRLHLRCRSRNYKHVRACGLCFQPLYLPQTKPIHRRQTILNYEQDQNDRCRSPP